MVAFISPEYMESRACLEEINLAATKGKNITPLRLDCASRHPRWKFTHEMDLIISRYEYEAITIAHQAAVLDAVQLERVVQRIIDDWKYYEGKNHK